MPQRSHHASSFPCTGPAEQQLRRSSLCQALIGVGSLLCC